jgi:hypothetical protein
MKILVVVALKLEADHIITTFSLAHKRANKFDIYCNDVIDLVVCGIGAMGAAIATTLFYDGHQKVINLGLCGAKDVSIGELCKIKSVIDKCSQKKYMLSHEGFALTTLAQPSNDPRDFSTPLCDMEASGFYLAASKVVKKENISIYKIISDHLEPTIDKQRFLAIIGDQFTNLLQSEFGCKVPS